ncbi:MAG TPA: 2-oxo acid dehydrogenase subunit E2 [Chloroflexia bacterium]|nr:2-oxo acid dehydrogenase subunit E2 [Chloroflexia bacterium]
MRKQSDHYEVLEYSKLRQALALTLKSAQHTPMIHGLLEVDVTEARELLREHKAKTGESISFTAFIVTCLARAIDENKVLQVCRKGSGHLVIFDDVDVATAIERDMLGQKQPVIYIIRGANKKTLGEIHREIRQAQAQEVRQVWEGFQRFEFMPLILFRFFWPIFWWLLVRSPRMFKKYGGTVGLSAIGMFGKGAGWGIPVSYRTQVTLGGISQKPCVIDGQIVNREYLCLTLSFDHTLVDGAPMARFAGRFKELIERGYGLSGLAETNAIPLPLTTHVH